MSIMNSFINALACGSLRAAHSHRRTPPLPAVPRGASSPGSPLSFHPQRRLVVPPSRAALRLTVAPRVPATRSPPRPSRSKAAGSGGGSNGGRRTLPLRSTRRHKEERRFPATSVHPRIIYRSRRWISHPVFGQKKIQNRQQMLWKQQSFCLDRLLSSRDLVLRMRMGEMKRKVRSNVVSMQLVVGKKLLLHELHAPI